MPVEAPDDSPSALIDSKIAALDDWRGKMLGVLRALIREADPRIVEAVKWRKPSNPAGVPVWEHGGIVCTGEVYRDKVKLTFAQGAAVQTPLACSTRASTAAPGAPSICARAQSLMRRRSRR